MPSGLYTVHQMIRCAGAECTVDIDAILGGGVHRYTGLRYCGLCARRINEAAGETLVVIPKFNTSRPNLNQVPRDPR